SRCVELADRIVASLGPVRRGPGRPGDVTDAGLVCPAVARVLLRYDNERHRLRAAPALAGHLFPRLLRQSQDSERLKDASALLETALRWLADAPPPGALRPVPRPRETLEPVRACRIRVLRLAQPLLPGRQAHAHRDLRRDRHRLRPGQPQADGRTRGNPAAAHRAAAAPRSSRTRASPGTTSRSSSPVWAWT